MTEASQLTVIVPAFNEAGNLEIILPVLIAGRGESTGSMLGISAGIFFFLLGLVAEQLSALRKNR